MVKEVQPDGLGDSPEHHRFYRTLLSAVTARGWTRRRAASGSRRTGSSGRRVLPGAARGLEGAAGRLPPVERPRGSSTARRGARSSASGTCSWPPPSTCSPTRTSSAPWPADNSDLYAHLHGQRPVVPVPARPLSTRALSTVPGQPGDRVPRGASPAKACRSASRRSGPTWRTSRRSASPRSSPGRSAASSSRSATTREDYRGASDEHHERDETADRQPRRDRHPHRPRRGRHGLATVAVYSEDDAASPAPARGRRGRALAGPGPAAYLECRGRDRGGDGAGCDAIHPGYGFLAENAANLRGCAEAGLTFVGPTWSIWSCSATRPAARAAAARRGVPVLPRTRPRRHASMRRGPSSASLGAGGGMMVKALAGGGGRGMRAGAVGR